MSITITRIYSRNGLSRYYVGFPGVASSEFLIQSPPRPQTVEWQRLFIMALSIALQTLDERLPGEREKT